VFEQLFVAYSDLVFVLLHFVLYHLTPKSFHYPRYLVYLPLRICFRSRGICLRCQIQELFKARMRGMYANLQLHIP
jgi:hypothetical protein